MIQRDIPAVGIDLGTTYSAVAILDEKDCPQTLLNAEGDRTTPSVLLFNGQNIVIGKQAELAKGHQFESIAEYTKRDLGKRSYHKPMEGVEYPPETLLAYILNKLRKDTIAQIGEFDKAVITVPAYFDESRRKATQDAGYLAGLDVLDIINEPTAAAIAYGYQQDDGNSGSQTVLVYDLGGGTFDVTIIKIEDKKYLALATDGDVKLGGVDWDERLVNYMAEQFIATYDVDPRDDKNSLGQLWQQARQAKHSLSNSEQHTIQLKHRQQDLVISITREQFESLTEDLLERTRFTASQTVKAAGLTWNDIDHVLLVGGSTRMPAVSAMLRLESGTEPNRSVSPDEAVAHGAALHAGRLLDQQGGRSPNFSVTNVNSHTLGVVGVDPETKRPRTARIIPRNTCLPITAKRDFRMRPDQQSIKIEIVEGESRSPDACQLIGACIIRGIPTDLPDHSAVEVFFKYKEDGRLKVKVRVKGTDIMLDNEFLRENTMSQEQLDIWRDYITG
ncbi:MAG: molecular chaperone DnaK [Planctomycetaceae bacterium]|nr:molecular chaperone DnaK [Planctomycetaceae bacterium]